MNEARRIVISGASSGIGQAIAQRLSNDDSIIVNLDIADGEVSRGLCLGQFETIAVDLADPDAVQYAFEVIDQVFDHEPPELLVCCAALSRGGPFLDVPAADLDLLLDVNVKGTFRCCQAAAGRMRGGGAGRIVVITSIAAAQGWAGESVYCVTKGAQQSLVTALAVELAPFNIMVNAVAPGIIEQTGESMTKSRTDPQVLRHDLERTPLGRFGSPAQVADAVAYLAGAEWVTGQTLYVDGGFMATGLAYLGEARERLDDEQQNAGNRGNC